MTNDITLSLEERKRGKDICSERERERKIPPNDHDTFCVEERERGREIVPSDHMTVF